MFTVALILILSTGLCLIYVQIICEKILRRQFEREYFKSIANANRLEFPALRKSLEEFGAPVDYSRLRMVLRCDFLALTYLLKHCANVNQRYTYEERLLILYFKLVFVSLATRHWLGLRETPAVLKLTAILQYFANVVAERVNNRRSGGGFLPPLSPSRVTISGLEA
ncbi:MAG: hypothetical protein ABSE79_15190 [Terriglobia bacterium]|jgi:hypothetical protein